MKIIVKHSRIEIHGYELGSSKLESIFSIYDKITHCSHIKGISYDEEVKILYVPRGLDIYYLESLFGIKPTVDYKHDPFDTVSDSMIKYLPRDDIQKEALRFMIGEGNYSNNKKCSQLSVNLNTGKGKTYCSITNSAFLNMKSIIITSSVNWLEQWKKCILEYTDIKEKEICIITGTPAINRILSADTSKYKFLLVSHATIRSYGEKNGWDKVTELFIHLRVGIKYYDESHLDFDNICKIDYNTNTFKTYYITATPQRSNEEENRIYQLYFKNVPSISLFDEDNDPHTDYISIRYNSKPTPQDISKCRNQYGLDRNKYVGHIVENDNFYKMLTILMNIILQKVEKTLIYIGTNDAIEKVYDWMVSNYPAIGNDVGIYTSKTPKSIKQGELDKLIILSTTKSCGPAVDIKGLKNTVVLAEPFKSEVIARQTLGRTRDDDTRYYEIVDVGFGQIQKYYSHKKPVFEKYATSCREVNIKEMELDKKYKEIYDSRGYVREYDTVDIFVKKE